jgi:hypothetical protein
MQFWPRLEIGRCFVLSELRRFLFVRLCRLEMVELREKKQAAGLDSRKWMDAR